MYDLAPGNVLQNMHLRRRLRAMSPVNKSFIEVGAGNGNLSSLLLSAGMRGIGFDLNADACSLNRERNLSHIAKKRYAVIQGDFLETSDLSLVDVILSSMVIEHLSPDNIQRYFSKCRSLLKPGGRIITLVPSSMRHWGIEDEIAGHYKRYEYADFRELAETHSLVLEDLSGLTYPLSNLLLKVSNWLISRNESWKKGLSMEEKTRLSASGPRHVFFKTAYPSWVRLLVNEVTMAPFYLLQRLFHRHRNCLVIYCELLKTD